MTQITPRPAPAPSPYDDAALYDQIFGDLDMDVAFYRGLARETRGPILEIGCGTGRVTLPCLKDGADLDGLDLSAPMLAALERKARALGLAPRLHAGDMRDFTLPRRYALITIPFNAFLHNLTAEDQLRTLRCCREHLLSGGRLAMHVSFFSSAIVGESGGEPALELETRDPATGHLLQHYDHRTMDPVRQLQHSRNEIRELDATGRVVATRYTETAMRWIYPSELELLLRVAGYARWALYGGFDLKPLESEHDQVIAFAWKD
jgi:SAM-dependent methyltransferase